MKKIPIFIFIIILSNCNTTAIEDIEILNLSELKIDNKFNNGMLLIDFGEIVGDENITKNVTIKNKTKRNISFEDLDINTNEINFDWGNKAIEPNEVRDLKFTIIAGNIEGEGFSTLSISDNNGTTLMFGYKYKASEKIMKYSIENDKLKIEESNHYIFKIKNIGNVAFNIMESENNNQNIIITYPEKDIKPNEIGKIIVKYTKDNNYKNKVEFIIKIDRLKTWMHSMPGFETEEEIELSIE